MCLSGNGGRESNVSWIKAGFEGGIYEAFMAVTVARYRLN